MQFALFYNKAGCVELNRAAAIHSFKRTGLEEKKGVKSKMAKDKMYGKTLRKNFARHEEIVEMPNLLALQKKSYQWFLDTGLREVFSDVASISNYAGNLELSFIDYKMDEAPKYDVLECKARDATYAAPLKVSVRLYNKETGEIKEQEIFMGDFPLMTESGTFVINGAERVVVSQLVRSPGIYYGKEIDLKTDLPLLTSTVIPYRGAWLEYETDANEMFWVRIDKNRKIPITELVRAIGFKTDAEILELFGDDDRVAVTLEKDACKTYEEAMLEIYRKLRPGEPPTVEACETLINNLFFDPRRYDLSMVGRYKFNKKPWMKTMMTVDDTLSDWKLGTTTKEAFTQKCGEGTATETVYNYTIGMDMEKVTYDWGYACFARLRTANVLVELYMTRDEFTAPRKTQIGSTEDEVVSVYKDFGQVESPSGNRGLYESEFNKGKIYKQEDGTKIIRYRVETGDSHIWQLDYELNTSGTVDAIRWSYEP